MTKLTVIEQEREKFFEELRKDFLVMALDLKTCQKYYEYWESVFDLKEKLLREKISIKD